MPVPKYTDVLTNASMGRPAITSVDLPRGGPSPPLAALGARLHLNLTDNLTARSTARTGRGPVRVNPKIDAVAVALLRLAFDLDGSYR
jgi:hypothetical protein